ncbi:MAG: hypothetical protein MI745_16645 [Pseudomonadales bacterium]|nr:hypothetical protein [Pseudomonadales bacterium]
MQLQEIELGNINGVAAVREVSQIDSFILFSGKMPASNGMNKVAIIVATDLAEVVPH